MTRHAPAGILLGQQGIRRGEEPDAEALHLQGELERVAHGSIVIDEQNDIMASAENHQSGRCRVDPAQILVDSSRPATMRTSSERLSACILVITLAR